MLRHTHYAIVAQLVERHLAKVEIAGSSPVYRSFLLSKRRIEHFYPSFLFLLNNNIRALDIHSQIVDNP